MKRTPAVAIALFAAVLSLAPTPGLAATDEVGTTRKVGIGFMVGEPTGLSGKYWLTDITAMDFGAAWSFVDDTRFHLHADYLVHDLGIFKPDTGRAALYYGIGGRLKFEKRSRLGMRGVIGLNYMFAEAPVDAFVELGPVLDMAPKTDFGLMGGLGIRMFFGPGWQ